MIIRKKKKSEKLFWVGGFWYGSVDLPETQIFFSKPNVSGNLMIHCVIFETLVLGFFDRPMPTCTTIFY